MKVWIIDSMGCRARLCISLDEKEPQLLVGPDIPENEELFTHILSKCGEITGKQINNSSPKDQGN